MGTRPAAEAPFGPATTPNGNGLSVYYRGSTDGGASYGSWVQTTVIGNPTHISGGNVMDVFTGEHRHCVAVVWYTAEFEARVFNSYSGAVTDVPCTTRCRRQPVTFPITTAPLSVLQPRAVWHDQRAGRSTPAAPTRPCRPLNASRPVVSCCSTRSRSAARSRPTPPASRSTTWACS